MKTLIKNKIQKINFLCKNHGVEKLWIFGSINTNNFTAESDIDFLVDFEPMNIEDYAENYFLLADSLETLFERKIDLVTVNSLSNPYFIEEVNNSKLLIYDRQKQEILV